MRLEMLQQPTHQGQSHTSPARLLNVPTTLMSVTNLLKMITVQNLALFYIYSIFSLNLKYTEFARTIAIMLIERRLDVV